MQYNLEEAHERIFVDGVIPESRLTLDEFAPIATLIEDFLDYDSSIEMSIEVGGEVIPN